MIATAADRKVVRLEQVCSNITDGKHGDCRPQPGSGFYFLSCKDVFNGKLNYETARQITEPDFGSADERTRLEPQDIVITNSGTIGRLALVLDHPLTRRTTFQKSVAIIKPIPAQVEPRYLLYQLSCDVQRLIDYAGGTAQKNLLLRDLRAFTVVLPSRQTQRKISAILGAYDDLIENTTRRIKILEEMAQRIYREWFVDFRYPGHEGGPLVDSELGPIPKGWGVHQLEDCVGLVSRGPSITYPETGKAPVEDLVGVINQRCVREGVVTLEAVRQAKPLRTSQEKLYVRVNDVLINSMGVGTLGRVGRNLDIRDRMIVHSCITLVRARSEHLAAELLYYVLRDCEKDFERRAIGATGQTSLPLNAITQLNVPVPPLGLQREFAVLVGDLWAHVTAFRLAASNLRATRDLLLPRLISGEIDVTDLDIAIPEAAA